MSSHARLEEFVRNIVREMLDDDKRYEDTKYELSMQSFHDLTSQYATTYSALHVVQATLNKYIEGVQRVYDQFDKVADAGFLNDFEHKRKELFYAIKEIKKEQDYHNKFIKKCYARTEKINLLYNLKDVNDGLIRKISAIINFTKFDNDFDNEESK